MSKNILLVGVGGQGIILMSKILTDGLMQSGFDVKMSEIHGMSQRGGSVTTQIKYGKKVFAPNIGEGEADIIIAFEKIEALRALPYLKREGTMIVDACEIFPLPVFMGTSAYPHDALEAIEKACPKVIHIRAAEVAEELGNVKAQNIVLLGALTEVLGLEGIDWEDLIKRYVPAKAKELNLRAFSAGKNRQNSFFE